MCGCQPWEYPLLASAGQEFFFCDMFGYICFEKMMEDGVPHCDCPVDCDTVTYSYSIVSTPMTEEKECTTTGGGSDFLEFFDHPFPPLFVLRAEEFMNMSSTSRLVDQCKKMLPYRAKVTFRLTSDTVSVTVRSKRLSFFDKLSGFGGILGLFTGMSILSMVEVTFWIIRFCLKRR